MTKKSDFSGRSFAGPFGTYQSGGEAGASNEVLVGREEQRSYLIELLLRLGRRGAYLVTGQRGAGKTSFVQYCLAEYKEEIFERFLRSNVGRVAFWDHLGVLLLAFGFIFALLMVSEFMEILALSAGWGKGNRPNILFGLVILPLALICLYPLLYARDVLGRVLLFGSRPEKAYVHEVAATGFMLVIAVVAFIVPPFGSPALSMSRMFLAICALYLCVQSVSFNPVRWEVWPLAALAAMFTIVTWGPILVTHVSWFAVSTTTQEFYGNIVWGLSLLGMGGILRGRHLRHTLQESATPSALYLAFGFLLIAGAGGLFLFLADDGKASWPSAAGSAICIFLALLSTSLSHSRESGASFRPQPRLILGMKALLCIVVSLQLIHPIFDKWTPPQQSFDPWDFLEKGRPQGRASTALPNQSKEVEKWPPPRRSPTALFEISSLSSEEERLRRKAEDLRIEKEEAERWLDLLNKGVGIKAAAGRRPGYQESEYLRTRSLHDLNAWLRQKDLARGQKQTDAELVLREADLFQQPLNSAVFYGRTEELSWVLALFLCLVALFFVEYEWVLRPFVRERADAALDLAEPAGWHDQIAGDHIDRKDHRRLAQVTLPWMLYHKWLPVLTVAVNLGFEKLDHRRVVHAMLAGLRDQYHRTFRAWNSSLANLGRILGFLVLMMLVTLAGDRWFALPSLERGAIDAEMVGTDYSDICDLFQGMQKGPGAANWICKLKWGESVFHILYYNLLDTGGLQLYPERDLHLLFYIFPYREEVWPAPEVWATGGPPLPPLLASGIHLRVYHVLLFLLFLILGRWLLRHLPIFPYQEILSRIDDTMDSLAARTSVTATTGSWKPAQWLQGFFVDERVRQTEQDPVDPRTVEFVFLQILHDIQGSAIHLPGGRNQLISLPTPEITFILDELDKIGTRVDPNEGISSGGPQQAEILNAERRRSMELHKLLADMKNLLSSAPARFIFVGGRNLHDEWLADQTSRQPLLTNIFIAEIYLPSLLTDHLDQSNRRLSEQVENYLYDQFDRARKLYRKVQEKRWLPALALPLDLQDLESYKQRLRRSEEGQGKLKSLMEELKIYTTDPGVKEKEFIGQRELVSGFIQFLTYRSMGNPKKLKELLGAFVRPAGRAVDSKVRWGTEFRDCDHVLFFGDTERFRIQLLARVYRHLTIHFEQGLVRRDDKLATSVLYLTDFLFKFHRRAFSWSNLERVDELVHIHRAPDLREVLEAIVAQWSERFLHPIRNGMYDFRFRSDMAREVEYVSRQSAEEMAAFNFTLDESQALKSAYETNIARLREENGKERHDLVAGLGELHEFDQEYEMARLYYRRAIALLDAELEEFTGGSEVLAKSSARIEIIGGVPEGRENARLYMTWGVARLRLMLQIGMTFEHSRNLERAEMEYQNARTLAHSLLLAMLDSEGRLRAADLCLMEAKDAKEGERLHALKHLNILFQPLFAEIWVAEKLTGGVDTSTTLAEQELWALRNVLPFVRARVWQPSASGIEAQGSNFALIATELHNKTGDLYFFKGRQLVALETPKQVWAWLLGEVGYEGYEGFLFAAHRHYAVGLHELRRFISHRRESSKWKLRLNVWAPDRGGLPETIAREGWPDFVLRAVGGAFNDLAEALLARVSLVGLVRECEGRLVPEAPAGFGGWVESFAGTCTRWLETEWDDGDSELRSLDDWFGKWQSDWEPAGRLIDFPEKLLHGELKTFLISLRFNLVGARYLKAGGYLEDAGRELLKVCETVTHYLWWMRIIQRLTSNDKFDLPALPRAGREQFLSDLFEVGLYALEEAERLFRRSRRLENLSEEDGGKSYLVGDKIPVFAQALACSLGLASDQWDQKALTEMRLTALLKGWGTKLPGVDFAQELRGTLRDSLVRHSYPMLNRLHMLKLLIDDAALKDRKEEYVEAWTEELLELEGSLNAPLHFTPLHSGTTCSLVGLLLEIERPERIRYAAERALLSSQEMYTMRRAFYENISDLYYLYDDFNDRQLHFNHAIQMAGTELASLLRYLLARPAS